MNPHEFHQMYKYLVRPSRAKIVESAKKELGIPKEVKLNNGSEVLDWIHWNQKMYGNNKMPLTSEERKTGEKIERIIASGNNVTNADQRKEKKEAKWKYTSRADELEEEEKIDPKEFEDIKKSLQVSPMVKKPKKKIVKKTLVVEKPRLKPKYINGNVLDITPLIQDDWWKIFEEEEPVDPKEEARLRYLRLKQMAKERLASEGIAKLLKLGRQT